MNSESTWLNSVFLKLVSPIALAITLASCQPVESEDIKTSGIYADIEVVSTSSGNADVSVSFRSSNLINASYIELTNNDSLIASSGSIPKVMNEISSFSKISYEANFDSTIDSAIFNISLDRPNDIDAPNTFVTMPEDMEITLPSNSVTFNLGDTLTLTWSPIHLGNTVDIKYNVQCLSGLTKTFNRQADDGLFTVQINDLLNGISFNQGSNCNVTITLARVNVGTVDNNYGKGGKIVGIVERSVVVFITP